MIFIEEMDPHSDPYLEFPNQEEEQELGEAESLVEEVDLLGVAG